MNKEQATMIKEKEDLSSEVERGTNVDTVARVTTHTLSENNF